MKHIFSTCLLIISCLLIACEEDVESGLSAPILEARGVQADRFSFVSSIQEDGLYGMFYYLVLESTENQPNAQEIKSSARSKSTEVNGRELISANMPGLASKTPYTVYAIVAVGDRLSKVASLQVSTQ